MYAEVPVFLSVPAKLTPVAVGQCRRRCLQRWPHVGGAIFDTVFMRHIADVRIFEHDDMRTAHFRKAASRRRVSMRFQLSDAERATGSLMLLYWRLRWLEA